MNKKMPTIALVDDDRNILTSVGMALENEGYSVQKYNDGAAALQGLQDNPPDMAIFDIKMPRMDGMELLRRIRQKSDLPVIFLTSKDDEIDELFGLKMGADDFIKKPFSQRLLVERVKAVMRRAANRDVAQTPAEAAKVIERGKLAMDPDRHSCTWDGKPVTLTVTEFLILQSLAQRLNGFRVETRRPTAAKVTRWGPVSSQVGARNVAVVRSPWSAALVAEGHAAPPGYYAITIMAFFFPGALLAALGLERAVRKAFVTSHANGVRALARIRARFVLLPGRCFDKFFSSRSLCNSFVRSPLNKLKNPKVRVDGLVKRQLYGANSRVETRISLDSI